jgi:hypothetical protein
VIRVVLPEGRVPGPDALHGMLPLEPPESLPPRFFEPAEGEFQATLIAFSFSVNAVSRES